MHEVFLSYAHLDNLDPENWVSQFHQKLERRLSVINGDQVKIWKDNYDLKGNELEKAINRALDATEILIALISPAYLKRDWCEKERKAFIDKTFARNAKVEPLERIFSVIKLANSDLDEEFSRQLPKELKSQFFFKFFGLDANRNPKELRHDDSQFDVSINDLAYKVKSELDRLRGSKKFKTKIYLAQTSSDLSRKREDIFIELEAHGFDVYPKYFLSDDLESLNQELGVYLKDCKVSIHLLSGKYGLIVPGTTSSLSKFQYEKATLASVPMVTWVCNAESSDVLQQKFLTDVFNNVSANNDIITRLSLEEFKLQIFDVLRT